VQNLPRVIVSGTLPQVGIAIAAHHDHVYVFGLGHVQDGLQEALKPIQRDDFQSIVVVDCLRVPHLGLHEALRDRFATIFPDGGFVHFASDADLVEDRQTVKYLEDVAAQAGIEPKFVAMKAIGLNAGAAGLNGVALGVNSRAGATGPNVAIGFQTVANNGGIAIGDQSQATGIDSIAIGTLNNVTGNNSGAFGDPNIVTGSGSYAFGNNNTVNANNAFVLGNNITVAVGLDGAVGIGNNTTVGAAVANAGATIGGTAYGFAGAAPAPTNRLESLLLRCGQDACRQPVPAYL